MGEQELHEDIKELKVMVGKLFDKFDRICAACATQKLECEKRFGAITIRLFLVGISCFLGGFGAAKIPNIINLIGGR
jgi:hypothetical protein